MSAKNRKHVVVEHREQEWTWKQAFLRRVKAPDAASTIGVFLALVVLILGALWIVV